MTPATPRARRLAVGLLAGVPVLLLVLATLEALRETAVPGLPVVPWQTLWGLPLDRWVRDLAAAFVLGFVVVGGLLLDRPDSRLLRGASLAALVWLAALICQVPLTVSEVLGRPWADSLDPVVVASLVTQTTLGQVILAQAALVTLVAILGWAVLGRVTGAIVLLLASVAAALPGLTGHSGLHTGHTVASISLAVHLLAVGTWVGGLIAVCSYLARPGVDPDASAALLRRFSVLALVCVLLLAESGLLNASLRVDGPAALVSSAYGALLLAKAILLAALIVLGWRQRQRAVPLGDPSRTVLRLASFEVLLMGLALGLSVALSRTAPPAATASGDRFTSAALTLLGLSLPLVLVWAGARPARLVRATAAYPEPFAVALLAAAAAASLILPAATSGVGAVAIICAAAVGMSGWCCALAVTGPRGLPAAIMVMVLWPVLAWWAVRSFPVETTAQVALSIVLAEVCVVLMIVLGRQRLRSTQESREEVSVA